MHHEPEPTAAADPRTLRMDMHAHSRFSDKPPIALLAPLKCAESYSEPEAVYEQARARGMDFVTLTDHDTIEGALELESRGFPGVVIGEEVTSRFPEDGCKVHVLVWGITPGEHESIGALGLRESVHDLSRWLRERNVPHALAHPLYSQNGRLRVEHLEKAALLFRAFELLNGAHSGAHVDALRRWLDALTPRRVQDLARKHSIEPLWPRAWLKGLTAGSDDHALLNVGRTWTEVRAEPGETVRPAEFLRRVMAGQSAVGGAAGHVSGLAHQLAAVAAQHYARTIFPKSSVRGRAVAAGLATFAGLDLPRPGRTRLALAGAAERLRGRRRPRTPLLDALRESLGPALAERPDLAALLRGPGPAAGPPLGAHESMSRFADDLAARMHDAQGRGVRRAWGRRDARLIGEHLRAYALTHAASLPYLVSLFTQNKERTLLEQLRLDTASRGSGAGGRPLKVTLFTDTLADINGVCRFIRDMARLGVETGRDFEVVTSTNKACPEAPNIRNFRPLAAMKIPKYDELDLTLPPIVPILRHIDRRQPDVIHVSTPGPVGMVGVLAARMLNAPLVGVYHTDFPAFVDRLFNDRLMTSMTEAFMRIVYGPFRRVLTRSHDYADSLERMGMNRAKILPLFPGVNTSLFNPAWRDAGVWAQQPGVDPTSVKALYCGRVSVEKGLPRLVEVWREVHDRCARRAVKAELIVVGGGPYLEAMQRELAGRGAHFLGYKHGEELSRLYASSDLFLFPSRTDTLGQVVMESQASGVPAIVTDEGGPKEIVADGVTGRVIPAHEVGRWIDEAVFLLCDEEARSRMGRGAHQRMQRFSQRASFDKFWQAHVDAREEQLAGLGAGERAAANGAGAKQQSSMQQSSRQQSSNEPGDSPSVRI